jgi:hypothetical protein
MCASTPQTPAQPWTKPFDIVFLVTKCAIKEPHKREKEGERHAKESLLSHNLLKIHTHGLPSCKHTLSKHGYPDIVTTTQSTWRMLSAQLRSDHHNSGHINTTNNTRQNMQAYRHPCTMHGGPHSMSCNLPAGGHTPWHAVCCRRPHSMSRSVPAGDLTPCHTMCYWHVTSLHVTQCAGG